MRTHHPKVPRNFRIKRELNERLQQRARAMGQRILLRHYHELVNRSSCTEFWAIRP